MSRREGQPATSPREATSAILSLTALGVVYGDIGTSPLYALGDAFRGAHGVAPTPFNVLGVLSLIFWSLTFVVSYKYVGVLLKADNNGEGGILALMALIRGRKEGSAARTRTLLLFGLFGAALLYGDGVITPAVSVLGAVEGLKKVAPGLERFIVPITMVILVGLFLGQRHGTDRRREDLRPGHGALVRRRSPSGVWWASCSIPAVLAAINPVHAVQFFIEDGVKGFLILGAVVLVITGGEALYADMGHFGPRPIRVAWFGMVFPALMLNYFGQGALVLVRPDGRAAVLRPGARTGSVLPMLLIATSAAIVASQALISGAFSLTRQAVQLGYCPRVTIRHTSHKEEGQIYIPEVNWLLMVACLLCVAGFQSSSNLTAAYGIAVTGTMGITTLLFAGWRGSAGGGPSGGSRGDGALPGRRPGVLRRQPGEVRGRRLVPAGPGRRGVPAA